MRTSNYDIPLPKQIGSVIDASVTPMGLCRLINERRYREKPTLAGRPFIQTSQRVCAARPPASPLPEHSCSSLPSHSTLWVSHGQSLSSRSLTLGSRRRGRASSTYAYRHGKKRRIRRTSSQERQRKKSPNLSSPSPPPRPPVIKRGCFNAVATQRQSRHLKH